MRLKGTRAEREDRILRSTGRKDRHSKICTAKGPKDRRLRLSAHTAIQFYDVQDRLGCDRPSEAIDWLMKEAKSAIDALQFDPSPAQIPALEKQDETECFPNSGYGAGNQTEPRLNDEQNSFGFFLPSFSSGFRYEGSSNEFHHHLGVISPGQPPVSWSGGNSQSNSLHNNATAIARQEQLFSQGGTLQSSFTPPSLLALMNSPISNLGNNYDQIPQLQVCSNPFEGDGFPGFFVSHGNLQGGEEIKCKLVPNKTSLHYRD